MELYEAIRKRRSVRDYREEKIPRELLRRIVQAGIEAPSGMNLQLRRYIIVDDPQLLEPMRAMSRALQSAPAAVVIVVDPQPTKYGEFWLEDCCAAMENMLLAATAEGCGSCWIEGAIRRHEEELRDLLGVPQDLRVWGVMPVGRAVDRPRRPEKSRLEDVLHVNGFGK